MLQMLCQSVLFLALFCLRCITTNDDFTTGNNLFSSDVYKEYVKTSGGNFVFSPFSVEITLALLKAGARDATAEEIQRAVHLPRSNEVIKRVIDRFFKSLKLGGGNLKVYTANKIYVQEKLVVKELFQQVTTNMLCAEIDTINFSKRAQAAGTINRWVERQTGNKIRNLLDANLLKDARAVLVNALYFQAIWSKMFLREVTTNQDFYTTSRNKVQVPTMETLGIYDYCEDAAMKATLLRIPFHAKDAYLVIVLPEAKDGLSYLETHQVFSKQKYTKQEVKLSLPKFRIETNTQLGEILRKLGIKKIFSQEADLSGIAGEKGELRVGPVVQKSFIAVDEKGVEAGAATAAVLNKQGGEACMPPKEFFVDHPFVFSVQVNGVVLLAGRVLDPTK